MPRSSWQSLEIHRSPTLPETNSLHPKMDGWNTIVSFWVSAYFQVLWLLVSGRVNMWKKNHPDGDDCILEGGGVDPSHAFGFR